MTQSVVCQISYKILELVVVVVVVCVVTASVAVATVVTRDVFRPRQTRQLPRAVDLNGRLLSCQSY